MYQQPLPRVSKMKKRRRGILTIGKNKKQWSTLPAAGGVYYLIVQKTLLGPCLYLLSIHHSHAPQPDSFSQQTAITLPKGSLWVPELVWPAHCICLKSWRIDIPWEMVSINDCWGLIDKYPQPSPLSWDNSEVCPTLPPSFIMEQRLSYLQKESAP